MRIGMLAPPWLPVPPPAYGGTESVIDVLCRGLRARGEEVLLWTVGESTCPVERGAIFSRAQTDRMGEVVLELHQVLAAYEAFEAWGAAIVHDHTVAGPFLARWHGTPVVTTNHGPFDDVANARYQAVTCEVPVIAISEGQASSATQISIAAVIHHGLDIDRYPLGSGTGDERGEYLVYLGRMAPEKGAAVAAQIAHRAGMRLVIAAKMHSGPELRYFEREVRPLLDDRVTFAGEVAHEDKVRLLGGARALLNPISWPEPFGLVMVEALACGTPVVATQIGSVPEIVDDDVTGFVCSSTDEMVRRLAELSTIDRAACRRSAAKKFCGERMVEEHVTVYERVIAAAGSRAPAGEAA